MDTKDYFDDIQKKIPNILSHFRNMSPATTSETELAVLDKGKLVIEKLDETTFGLCFHLPVFIYDEITEKVEEIEASLFNKAEYIFKYFAGTKVSFVKLKKKTESN